MRNATVSAMSIPVTNTETGREADPTWQSVRTQAPATRRGRGTQGASLTHKPSAPATPAVRENWPGAGRMKGGMRSVQMDSSDALPP